MTQRYGFTQDLRGGSPGAGETRSTFDRLLREYFAISRSASADRKGAGARLLLTSEVIGAVSTFRTGADYGTAEAIPATEA